VLSNEQNKQKRNRSIDTESRLRTIRGERVAGLGEKDKAIKEKNKGNG
jgi:hypothetical protein